MSTYILDQDGNPQHVDDLMEWAQWFESANRQVALDEVGDQRISTIFLGLNHSLNSGIPLLYETMIFGGQWDLTCHRYATRDAALAGHAQVLAALCKGEDPS